MWLVGGGVGEGGRGVVGAACIAQRGCVVFVVAVVVVEEERGEERESARLST